MLSVRSDHLRAGDTIVDGGRARRIVRVDHRPGWAWPIGWDDTGWANLLGSHLIQVQRTEPDVDRAET
jgi:hypothetical protein